MNAFESSDLASHKIQSLTDEDLLRLCARGEELALKELVQRYKPALTRLLSRFLSSKEDVEEAVLSVFLRAWQAAPRFQYRARASTWLYRIATNIAYDIGKHRRVQSQQFPSEQMERVLPYGNAEDEVLERLDHEEKSLALQRALNRLRPTDRLIIVLYYYEQMEYEQIQMITKLSYNVLKTRLTRARRRLRQLLEQEDNEAGR